jgi:hypothetical protein
LGLIYDENCIEQVFNDYANEVSEKKRAVGLCLKGELSVLGVGVGCMYLSQFVGQNAMTFYSTYLFL